MAKRRTQVSIYFDREDYLAFRQHAARTGMTHQEILTKWIEPKMKKVRQFYQVEETNEAETNDG